MKITIANEMSPKSNRNSHLRVSTLVDIAITIERDLGITQKCTVEEMWKNLVDAAGHCRTRKEAAAAISKHVYNQEKEP